MKTKLLLNLIGLCSFILMTTGCVVHEHSHAPRHHHQAHVHGPGCGHVLRGTVWVVVP